MAANINYFLQKAGGDKNRADRMFSDYKRATKGLDARLAFQALDGGGSFDTQGGDMQRYNKLIQAKEKAQVRKDTPQVQPRPKMPKKEAQMPIGGFVPKPSSKPKAVQAKEKAQSYKGASEAYFADAQKRSGIRDNTAAHLKAEFEKQTKGLDKELAFKALDGGRMFGESDMARYKKLLAEKNKKSQDVAKPAVKPDVAKPAVMPKVAKPAVMPTDNKKGSEKKNEGIIGSGNQQFKDSGNIVGDGNMGGIGNVNTDASFNTGDIDANIGKQGDMTTTVENSQFGAGASVGNDYSVTVGNMRFGNTLGGVDVGSDVNPLSNMQAATAYNALNDNFLARSKSQLNGYGRAAGAIEEARKANSRPNKDQEAAFKFAGANQNYLRDRVSQIRDGYMGSTEGFQAPSFMMPIAPRPVDLDPGKDIYEDTIKFLK